jgi:hypothetical protein
MSPAAMLAAMQAM